MGNKQKPLDMLLHKIENGYKEITITWNNWSTKQIREAVNFLIEYGYVKIDETKPLTEETETFILIDSKKDYFVKKLKPDGKDGFTALLHEQREDKYLVAYNFILGDYTYDEANEHKDLDSAIIEYEEAPIAGYQDKY